MKPKWITPFSNGSEAISWAHHNCDKCTRALKQDEDYELPSFEEAKRLVAEGKECRMKLYLDMGFISGKIPLEIAEQIGYKNSRLEWCKKFTTEPEPTHTIHNPNQLSLFGAKQFKQEPIKNYEDFNH